MKSAIIPVLLSLIILCCTACDGNVGNPTVSSTIAPSVDPTVDSENSSSENTAILLNMNGTHVRAHLYDNTAARSFQELLPFSITVSRATDDLCGSVSQELATNPEEDSDTWKIGEIGWFDGWFTILCDNEEGMRKRSRTIIGMIDDEDIPFVQSLEGTVRITITDE